jgi:hypothetical protein
MSGQRTRYGCTARVECVADEHQLCCPSVKRRREAELEPPAEPQVWEQKVPGSDLAAQRLHLQVDDEGRVRLHEAVVEQLLLDAGWERA